MLVQRKGTKRKHAPNVAKAPCAPRLWGPRGPTRPPASTARRAPPCARPFGLLPKALCWAGARMPRSATTKPYFVRLAYAYARAAGARARHTGPNSNDKSNPKIFRVARMERSGIRGSTPLWRNGVRADELREHVGAAVPAAMNIESRPGQLLLRCCWRRGVRGVFGHGGSDARNSQLETRFNTAGHGSRAGTGVAKGSAPAP